MPAKTCVVWIKDLGQVLGKHLVRDRLNILAAVEVIQVEFFGGLGRPQPERIHGPAAIAHDRKIVSDPDDGSCVEPVVLRPSGSGSGLDMTSELDLEREFRMRDFPWIAVLQPFIGLLDLVAIFDVLLENPEIVAQSIADPGKIQGGDRIQKTCCEPAQAAIAEASIDLVFPQVLPIEPHLPQGRAAGVLHLQIDDIVAHHSPDQELERQVIDPFHIPLVMRLLSRNPSIDQLISHGQGQRIIAVPVGCAVAIPGKGLAKMALEILPQNSG